jgi:hypothetical protein
MSRYNEFDKLVWTSVATLALMTSCKGKSDNQGEPSATGKPVAVKENSTAEKPTTIAPSPSPSPETAALPAPEQRPAQPAPPAVNDVCNRTLSIVYSCEHCTPEEKWDFSVSCQKEVALLDLKIEATYFESEKSHRKQITNAQLKSIWHEYDRVAASLKASKFDPLDAIATVVVHDRSTNNDETFSCAREPLEKLTALVQSAGSRRKPSRSDMLHQAEDL